MSIIRIGVRSDNILEVLVYDKLNNVKTNDGSKNNVHLGTVIIIFQY